MLASDVIIECQYGTVRVSDETALVLVGGNFQVWRGPFEFDIDEPFVVRGPRGAESPAGLGLVVSWFQLR